MLILRWKSLSASGVARAMGLAIWAIAPAGGLAACVQPRSEAQELLVFAAASLGNALGEIEEIYEERSQTDVLVSYGASQMLAQQIASGAPADVFISAGEFPVEFLTRREMLDSAVSELLTTNLVVAIRTAGGPQVTSMEQLAGPGVGRIAVADPEVAPAGRYARESLVSLGIWDDVQTKLVFGSDVRATLAYVESGNADVGIVYGTDARAAPTVTGLDIVPSDSHSPIRYPAAVVKKSRNKETAAEFLDFLRSSAAREVFRKHGFEPVE